MLFGSASSVSIGLALNIVAIRSTASVLTVEARDKFNQEAILVRLPGLELGEQPFNSALVRLKETLLEVGSVELGLAVARWSKTLKLIFGGWVGKTAILNLL